MFGHDNHILTFILIEMFGMCDVECISYEWDVHFSNVKGDNCEYKSLLVPEDDCALAFHEIGTDNINEF